MKNLGTLQSIEFFCFNGTCEASSCRCSLTYEPKVPESFWDWTPTDIRWGIFALSCLTIVIAGAAWGLSR